MIFMRIVLDSASFVTAVRSSGGAAGEVGRMIFGEELVPLMHPQNSVWNIAMSEFVPSTLARQR
jgi:hypothetical protein